MKINYSLKIIALFGSVVEGLAIIALVLLPPVIQSTFVYFVIAFPAVIILLFVLILYSKNGISQAPANSEE